MATLDRVTLEYFLPEEEPHDDVPRVDEVLRLDLTIDQRSVRIALGFRVVQVFERIDENQSVRKAVVWADRLDAEGLEDPPLFGDASP